MRIGLSGYGTMGKLIRQQALAAGHEVPVVIDPLRDAPEVTHKKKPEQFPEVDVIIDFSVHGQVVDNLTWYARKGISVVVGTTGWYARMDEVKAVFGEANSGCIWSGNFSLGVNLFMRMAEAAGSIMNQFPQYDSMIHEYFHKNKTDSPSGTAEMLGNILLSVLDRKSEAVTERLDRKIADHELHISSTRGGSIPGTHRVTFDSDVDTIVLEHTARNRSGFAEGAVLAAEWIVGKKGLYTIDDMMKNIIEGEN